MALSRGVRARSRSKATLCTSQCHAHDFEGTLWYLFTTKEFLCSCLPKLYHDHWGPSGFCSQQIKSKCSKTLKGSDLEEVCNPSMPPLLTLFAWQSPILFTSRNASPNIANPLCLSPRNGLTSSDTL